MKMALPQITTNREYRNTEGGLIAEKGTLIMGDHKYFFDIVKDTAARRFKGKLDAEIIILPTKD